MTQTIQLDKWTGKQNDVYFFFELQTFRVLNLKKQESTLSEKMQQITNINSSICTEGNHRVQKMQQDQYNTWWKIVFWCV